MILICIKQVLNWKTRAIEEQQYSKLGSEKGKMISDCGHLRKGFLKEMALGVYAMYLLGLNFLVEKRVDCKISVILSSYKICFFLRSPNAYDNTSHIISIQNTSGH